MLVHEVFFHGIMRSDPTRPVASIDAVASYHTRDDEVGRIASLAATGCLVLNHFVPTDFDAAALLAKLRADYRGPIVVGEDLMRLDLAARSVTHAHLTLGY